MAVEASDATMAEADCRTLDPVVQSACSKACATRSTTIRHPDLKAARARIYSTRAQNYFIDYWQSLPNDNIMCS